MGFWMLAGEHNVCMTEIRGSARGMRKWGWGPRNVLLRQRSETPNMRSIVSASRNLQMIEVTLGLFRDSWPIVEEQEHLVRVR